MILLDATFHRNKPWPVLPGCSPLRIIYGDEPYPRFPAGTHELPPEQHLRDLARKSKMSREPGELLCLDIEHLPTDLWHEPANDGVVESALDHLGYIADVMHDERPGLRLGYYGVMPTDLPGNLDFLRKQVDAASARKLYGRDAKGRFEAEGLADKVDVIFPVLYSRYDTDAKRWQERARQLIGAARKYHKQVYPFLWDLHMGTGEPIPADWWRVMLETCLTLADGAVIWSGWRDKPVGGYVDWDDNAAWWKVVQEFTN